MYPLAALVAYSLLNTPAPLPHEFPTDPDQAIAQFEKEGEEIPLDTGALLSKQQRLLGHLKEARNFCLRKGQRDRAEALRERMFLLQANWKGTTSDRGATVKGLETALVHGKYRHLLRVLYMPADKGPFGDFNDFGAYPATDYAGVVGLPSGYWVYVSPCWYLWRDRTGRSESLYSSR